MTTTRIPTRVSVRTAVAPPAPESTTTASALERVGRSRDGIQSSAGSSGPDARGGGRH
jgi:hypothetical protein